MTEIRKRFYASIWFYWAKFRLPANNTGVTDTDELESRTRQSCGHNKITSHLILHSIITNVDFITALWAGTQLWSLPYNFPLNGSAAFQPCANAQIDKQTDLRAQSKTSLLEPAKNDFSPTNGKGVMFHFYFSLNSLASRLWRSVVTL